MDGNRQFGGKAVLVTGGSRGIGAAIARRFGALGADVAVVYRSNADEAGKVVGDLTSAGGRAVAIQADVAKPADVARMVEEATAFLGLLDIVVNAAGVSPYLPLGQIDEDHYREIFDVHVLGSIMVTQEAARVLPEGGRIVHFSSRLATAPLPRGVVYSASKAAVSTLVHGFAKELGPKGITVNAVAPGVIETDMTEAAIRERGEAIVAGTPLGRIGQPDDIVGIVTFLASDEARWITGRTILADGGFN